MSYGAIRSNTGKALGKVGQSMTLTRTTDPAFDPISGGTLTIATQQTWPLSGVKTNFNSMDRLSFQNATGSLIQIGDAKVLLQAVEGVIPMPGDQLTIAGELWRIVAVDDVNPAGIAVLYKCQVRK